MATRTPVLVFDGDCAFCTSAARWAERGWSSDVEVAAWQDLGAPGLGALGLSVAEAQAAAWWVDDRGRRWRGSRAIGKALEAAGGRRAWAGHLALTPPTSWVAAALYRLVVRFRHRLPGGTPACKVPDAPKHAA
jgi:predicted DCC family thiol-disulfide oxidoreductase YuxK